MKMTNENDDIIEADVLADRLKHIDELRDRLADAARDPNALGIAVMMFKKADIQGRENEIAYSTDLMHTFPDREICIQFIEGLLVASHNGNYTEILRQKN
jgi:hypothetical protein